MSTVRNEVGKTSLINVVGYSIRIVVSFLTTLLVSRWLGPEEFGDASLIISSIAFFLYFFTCGFDHSLIFFVSRFLADGRPNLAKKSLKVALTSSAIVSAATIGIVSAILSPILEFANRPYLFWPSLFFLFQMPIAALGYIYGGYLRGAKAFLPVIIKDQLLIPMVGLLSAIVLTKVVPLGIIGYALAQLFSYVAGLAYIGWKFFETDKSFKSLSVNYAHDTIGRSKSTISSKVLFKFSLPVGVGSALEPLVTHSCVMASGAILASSDIGRFSVSLRIALFSQLFLQAIVPVFAPFFSELSKKRKLDELRSLHHNVQYWCSKWALFFSVAALFCGDYLLAPFGPEYSSSVPILWGLLIGCAIEGGLASTRQSLVMIGRNVLNMINFSGAILLNVALTAILSPSFGVWGLVISFSTTYAVLNLVRCLEFWYIVKISPLSFRQSARLAGFSLITGLVYLVYRELPATGYIRPVSAALILATSFLILFWQDRDLIRLTLRRRVQ